MFPTCYIHNERWEKANGIRGRLMTLTATQGRPEYGSVRAAVIAAYKAETISTLRKPSFERVSAHYGSLTAFDRVAQGAMAMQAIRQALGSRVTVLDAKYTVASSGPALERKQAACRQLAAATLDDEDIYGTPNADYAGALVEYWAGLGEPPDARWSKRLGLTTRQLKFWRYGRSGRPGVQTQLDRDLAEALMDLEAPLAAAGLV